MDKDLRITKKKYGEKMAHFCRDAFSTILEQEGVLPTLFLKHFEPSKFLYTDLEKKDLLLPFKNFIYSLIINRKKRILDPNIKTPQELLNEAGYDLYECKSVEELQNFKKYYAPNEEICTFKKTNRLEKCHVFFAVKKDVENIKREDFKHPERQDEYGTSVISIQFDRNETHALSIKNRYNHAVEYSDSTFSNNLDNIIDGLSDSFALHYGLEQHFFNAFDIPQYTKDSDGMYHKYNYEIDGIYYCTNNIVVKQHEAISLPKERYILADYFIIDMKENTISTYDKDLNDGFVSMFQENPINSINVEKQEKGKRISIETVKGLVTLEIDEENRIIKLENPYVRKIEKDFMFFNNSITNINLRSVLEIGDRFFYNNETVKDANLLCARKIGNDFFYHNNSVVHIGLENVLEIGDSFFYHNNSIIYANLENVLEIGDCFFHNNRKLIKLDLSKVKLIGCNFLYNATSLLHLNLGSIEQIGYNFNKNGNPLLRIRIPDNEVVYNELIRQHPEYIGRIEMVESEERKR